MMLTGIRGIGMVSRKSLGVAIGRPRIRAEHKLPKGHFRETRRTPDERSDSPDEMRGDRRTAAPRFNPSSLRVLLRRQILKRAVALDTVGRANQRPLVIVFAEQR